MASGFARKRGDKWYAYWYENGEQRCKVVGKNKKEAEQFVNFKMAESQTEDWRALKEISFKQLAEKYLDVVAAPNVKPSTLASYRSIIEGRLIPTFGNQKLQTLSQERIQRYVAESLRSGLSATTVHKHVSLLRTMLATAVEWNHLRSNPAARVRVKQSAPDEMEFLTPEEVPLMLRSIDKGHRAFFTTLVLTGLRLGEAIGLRWSDVDWRSNVIRVERSIYKNQVQSPKSRRSVRRVIMTPHLRAALEHHRLEAGDPLDGLVFESSPGRYLDPANLRNRVFYPALLRAGLRRIRIHDLRHTFASLLIHQGENLKLIQTQLGHSSITLTVDRYGHLMPDAYDGVGARLDEMVFGTQRREVPVEVCARGPVPRAIAI